MVATVTAVDTHLTPTAIHTTAADGTDTDGIVMIGITVDGVAVADGVMMDTSLPAVTVDGVMAVDSVMKGMAAADTLSPIQDMAEGAIAADPTGHRISRTIM